MKVALGLELVSESIFLAGWLLSSGRPSLAPEVALVGVLAFAMGLQSGAVRALGVTGITTTYVTGTLTGLVGELAAPGGSRQDWVARIVVLVALTGGAACSALLVNDARLAAPALPLTVTSLVLLAAVRPVPLAPERG